MELGGRYDLGKRLARPWALALEGNWTYSVAQFSSNRFMRIGSDTVNVRGNALPYAPRHRAHAAIEFEHSAAGLRLRADGILVGRQFSDNFETVAGSANGRVGEIPAHRLLDLSGQYELSAIPGVCLTAAVRNVTDRTYIASRRPEGIKVGTPRLVTVGLRWGF